jgi:hypothetical protein
MSADWEHLESERDAAMREGYRPKGGTGGKNPPPGESGLRGIGDGDIIQALAERDALCAEVAALKAKVAQAEHIAGVQDEKAHRFLEERDGARKALEAAERDLAAAREAVREERAIAAEGIAAARRGHEQLARDFAAALDLLRPLSYSFAGITAVYLATPAGNAWLRTQAAAADAAREWLGNRDRRLPGPVKP